jgi:iron complex transport system ATP-binding protein
VDERGPGVLELKDLSVGYNQKPVLKGINMRIERGSFCALLGPNGCGKTTILKCINRTIDPIKGRVIIDGTDVIAASRRKIALLTGIMPSSTVTPFNYSGRQMVIMGKAPHMDPWVSPSKMVEAEADEVLRSLGIAHLSSKPFLQMSAGEQQLVILARVVLQNPPLMLLDEPTSHLDLKNQVMLMDMARDIARRLCATVLIALHDPNLALKKCDHSALISLDGSIDFGETSDVLNDENLTRVYGIKIRKERTESGEYVLLPIAEPRQNTL